MGISKTKLMLVDVARQLFAASGKDNVTMNDIANASQKGRRTLYTYFKSKNDVYLAVIERELKLLRDKLQEVVEKDIPADDKLIDYIFTREYAIKEAVKRNGSLKADFFRDIYEVETARIKVDLEEIKMIKSILDSGVKQDIFNLQDTQLTATLFLYALKGLEQAFIRDRITTRIEAKKENIVRVLLHGILKS